MTRFSAVARCFLGFAALGAGLVHLALAIGSATWLAAALIAIGAAEFLWGVFTVSRPGVPVPRVAIAGALVPIVAWVGLLVVGVDGPRPGPMLAATVLDLAVAIGVAAGLRRAPRPEPRHPLLGIAIAAALVAAITVPALIATEAPHWVGDLPAHDEPPH